MTISDETLMAFADGELDDAARAAVESPCARIRRSKSGSPSTARCAERVQRGLFGRTLGRDSGASAERLRGAPARQPQSSAVVGTQRVACAAAANAVADAGIDGRQSDRRTWAWDISCCRRCSRRCMRSAGGAMIARGPLAPALSNQLAAEQSAASPVQIGLSFLAKSGDYCRTFVLSGAMSPAGLACRHGGEWQVLTLTEERGPRRVSPAIERRAQPCPRRFSSAVEGQIAGEPLDQAGERARAARDWAAPDRKAADR